MPKIPVYNSQVSVRVTTLNTTVPAIQMDASSFTQEARAATQLGVTVGNIAENIIKVKADQEYAKAKIEGYKALSQIETEASEDNDFQNFESKYSQRIKDTQSNILKNIKNPVARQTFQQDFEMKSNYSFFDIMKSGRTRFIAQDKDLMAQETAITKERYFSASTPQEKQNAKDELASIFSRRAENKVLNKPEAANLYQKEITTLDEGQAEYDILSNPTYALGELQKGEQGIYKNLTQDKRTTLIDKAQTKIEKEEKIAKQIITERQNTNYKVAMLQAFDGQLSEKVTQELYRNGDITDTQFGKLNYYLQYHIPATEDNMEVYNEIIRTQAEGDKSPEEINDIILQKTSKRELKNQTAKQLLGKTYTEYKTRKDELIALNMKEMRAVGEEFFRDELDEADKPKIESALYTFNKRIQAENADGERITEIAQEIMADTIRKDYPEINQVETINKVKEMFGLKGKEIEEIPPPKTQQEQSPFAEYPDAFKENGIWKVIRNGQKYRVEE